MGTDICRIALFAGPSIPPAELYPLLSSVPAAVRVHEPIRQGDVIRAMADAPHVIAILDGVFFQAPAVGHKEILLAMEKGVHVMGASSMGALRAAELDRFGMEGVGAVYRLFRDRVIDGDDMVAVTHGSAEDGYRATSEPLVNLRHNLLRARRHGIISAATRRDVLRCAQGLFFPERSNLRILRAAAGTGVDVAQLRDLAIFLRDHAVDLKLQDARLLLALLVHHAEAPRAPAARLVTVSRTTYLMRQINEYDGHRIGGQHVGTRLVTDLQRLLDRSFASVVRRVNLRCLALDEAVERGIAAREPHLLLERFAPWQRCPESARERWLRERYLTLDDLTQTLAERDLEERVWEALTQERGRPTPAGHALAASVSRRTGISQRDLRRRALMHPGVPWDGPLVREVKLQGGFRRALTRAGRVIQVYENFERRHPGLLSGVAHEQLFRWFAWRWRVPEARMSREIERRGFLGESDFVAVARIALPHDWLNARQEGSLPLAGEEFGLG